MSDHAAGALCLTALLATLLTLKATAAPSWSWWWILAPLWAPIVLAIVCVIVIVTIDAADWLERKIGR